MVTAPRVGVKIHGMHRAPDTRSDPAPRVGDVLLARPGLRAAGYPAVVLHHAERWSPQGRPLPYRAAPHARRTAVALYLGAGRWSPAVLGAAELARLGAALAAWPDWRAALLDAEAAIADLARTCPGLPVRGLAPALEAARRPPPVRPERRLWRARAAAKAS